MTETKIQILYDHVDHTRFHIVEMGCQMVQLLSAHIVGPTMFVNLTPAYGPPYDWGLVLFMYISLCLGLLQSPTQWEKAQLCHCGVSQLASKVMAKF